MTNPDNKFEDVLNQIKEIQKKCCLETDETKRATLKGNLFTVFLKAIEAIQTLAEAEELLKLAPSPDGHIAKTIRRIQNNIELVSTSN
ncbi:MAG: hypothetical protein WCT51_02700 [Candidatus Shapirobacteria bacterium]|jgi:hypothetical protein